MRNVNLLLLLFQIILIPAICYSAIIPNDADVGMVGKSLINKPQKIYEKQIPVLLEDTEQEQLAFQNSSKILINKIEFQGNTVFDKDILEGLMPDCIGKSYYLDKINIKGLANIITQHYRNNGYFLSYAYIEDKSIKDGNIIIKVWESYLDRIMIKPNKYCEPKFLYSHFKPLQKYPLKHDVLINVLLKLNDNKKYRVNVSFLKSKKHGAADILLSLEAKDNKVKKRLERSIKTKRKKGRINKIKFNGNTVFKGKVLQDLIDNYIGKKYSLKVLKKIENIITKKYKDNGYFLAYADISKNKIADDNIIINIWEGYLNKIKMNNNKYYNKKEMKQYFKPFFNKPLKHNDFLEVLMKLNEKCRVDISFNNDSKDRGVDVFIDVLDKMSDKEFSYKHGQSYIEQVVFKGNSVFDDKYLIKLLENSIFGKCTFENIKKSVNIITQRYKDKGYFLSRAYIPEQKIVNGTITIEIIEGYLGKVIVRNNIYHKKEFFLKYFRPLQGKPLQYDQLIRALLILNEFKGIKVYSTFKKGEFPGTADLILEVEDHEYFDMQAEYNNHGSRSVSKNREYLSFEYANLITSGDVIGVRGLMGSPVNSLGYLDMSYMLPINNIGTKASFGLSLSSYNVSGEYKELELDGTSDIYKLEIIHPFIRSKTTSIDMFLGFDHKSIKSYMLGAELYKDELRVARTGINFDKIDNWFKRTGRNFLNLEYSQGIPDFLDGSKDRDPIASRAGAGGDFKKVSVSCNRIQKIFGSTLLLLKANGQAVSNEVPSSEQIVIGGADTIRGYYISKASGDYGFNMTAELQGSLPFIGNINVPVINKKFSDILKARMFVDYGRVGYRSDTSGEHKHTELASYGFGVDVFCPWDFTISVDCSFPIDIRHIVKDKDEIVYMKVTKEFY